MPKPFLLLIPAIIFPALLAMSAHAAEDVDGAYAGTYSGTGNCPGGGPTAMTIRDRALTRNFGPGVTIPATVGADGAFTGQSGQTSMTGSVHAGHVDLDIVSGRGCRVHQSLDKK